MTSRISEENDQNLMKNEKLRALKKCPVIVTGRDCTFNVYSHFMGNLGKSSHGKTPSN
jgi:predicted transcriptional regulator